MDEAQPAGGVPAHAPQARNSARVRASGLASLGCYVPEFELTLA